MKKRAGTILSLLVLGCALPALSVCSGRRPSESASGRSDPQTSPAAAPQPADADPTEGTIRFLEARVKDNPDDFIAFNKLAGYYLQRQREAGDPAYAALASRAARASLAALPAEQNPGGLAALAQAAFVAHDFAAARDHATRLTELAPRESYPQGILGDALLELGDYEGAAAAYLGMERLEDFPSAATESRLARLALLHGETERAVHHFDNALRLALDERVVQRETVAWCRWQLGETAFAAGVYETAERHFRDALTTFPDYYRALASLARVRAARGDFADAIDLYERAVRIHPDPVYVSALGDLYKLSGREKEAAVQYALVEKIGRLNELNGSLYNRQLALFYADHELKPEEAYASAAKEYGVRRDIYGADALAWTALKAGRLEEARLMMREALRLGTRDARLFYHAGMIARAAGDAVSARGLLRRALDLNPEFDPLQAAAARKALEE